MVVVVGAGVVGVVAVGCVADDGSDECLGVDPTVTEIPVDATASSPVIVSL